MISVRDPNLENKPSTDTPLELTTTLDVQCDLSVELSGGVPIVPEPILIEKEFTANGEYNASDDNADGYSKVTVEVETDPPVLIEKSITDNGIYLASDDEADGYSSVNVEVPAVVPTLIEKSVNENGTYIASEDAADGYSKVTVEVPDPVLKTKNITENGTYLASSDNADGYSEVDVSVPLPVLKTKSITENGTYLASEDNADGYSSVEVDVQPVIEPYLYNINNVGFNSGHIHTPYTKVKCKVMTNTWYGYGQVFGARVDTFRTGAMGFFGWFDGYRPCYYRTGSETPGTYYNQTETLSSMWYGQPVIIECTGNSCSWYRPNFPDDVHSITATGTVDSGIAPLGIFCCNNSSFPNEWSSHDNAPYLTFYWLEIYENDVLEHRFVPAYNNNQYCLYDEIGETYIYEVYGNYNNLKGSPNIPTT